MTTSFAANAELSRCFAASFRSSCSKPTAAHQCSRLEIFSLGHPSPPALCVQQLTSRRTAASARVFSMSQTDSRDAGLTYKDAGVDIDAGSELVRRISKMAPGIGGFGGLFPLGDSYLVAGTDGVGTKLKLAFETGIHDTIGIDLVIKGIVDGCQQSECTLLGGETAEMPDFYSEGEYDLSGFAVGVVKKDSVIDGKTIVPGDALIGLPSSGVHSNGFSLVRRVLARSGLSLKDQLPGEALTLGEALMAPTVIYVKQVLDLISKGGVKGIAHITGGGFTDNIPRVFPEGLGALIYRDSWEIPAVFKWIQQAGNIEEAEMRRTFNMGIGMVLVVSQEAAKRILEEKGGASMLYRIGEVVKGEGVSYH
ncbi:phosphoribosylformylglycinamidine cyclo-ligase, chloroplastic/mitochondrial isoform X2 [Carica papaya]|uniref:phosphoribosylformylglycinamidine cyclo-ligase, chloroplastic/mitochondrial isoform X2 n=1 Tax=Carica papaya TaxID=3649 RepID=UPI000B8C7574|nr:phosphoribosylformylglycinamidine cyclo-ligase, chloroplastic/mitochondrial isoform X2 [Carica papaya]